MFSALAALGRFAEALDAYREVGDPSGTAAVLGNMAILKSWRGDLAGARQADEESLASAREAHDDNGVRVQLDNRAELLLLGGDLAGSARANDELAERSGGSGEKRFLAYALHRRGASALARGERKAARASLGEALALREQVDRKAVPTTQLALAQLEIDDGDPGGAEKLARAAATDFRSAKRREDEAAALAVVAAALVRQGDPAAARAALKPAEKVEANSQNVTYCRLPVALAAAAIHLAAGERDAAVTRYRAALADATRYGLASARFEALLGLLAAGAPDVDRTALVAEATARGFGRVAERAGK